MRAPVELLGNEEGETAAIALGQIGEEAKAAVPALTTLLGDKAAENRAAAAFALGEIGAGAERGARAG